MKIFIDKGGKWHPIAEDIVRCKDCRKGEEEINHIGYPCIRCKNPANGVGKVLHSQEWYCGDGEAKA